MTTDRPGETLFIKAIDFIQPRKTIRRAVSLFLISAIYLTPLFSLDSTLLQAFARSFGSCYAADRILQGCPLGGGQIEDDLTNKAIDDVIAIYKLPPTDRGRVMSYARNEVRAALFARLYKLLNRGFGTPAEVTAVTNFTNVIRQRRVLGAQKALEEYNEWNANPCVYAPPPPYTYDPGGACRHGLGAFFSGPIVPTFEEFQQFGSAVAYQQLFTPEGQAVSQLTTQDLAAVYGRKEAGIDDIDDELIKISYETMSALAPFAATATLAIAGAALVPTAVVASGAVSASVSLAGAPAIVIAGLAILVTQSINIANAAELPSKLQTAIVDTQNQNVDLGYLVDKDAGVQELYSNFLLNTLPDYPGSDVPPVNPNDRRFLVRQNGAGGSTESATIGYKDWAGQNRTARLSGGWFVENNGGTEKQTLSIQYIDWLGQKKVASRKAGQFVIFDLLDINRSTLTDEITYLGNDLILRGAKIKFTELTLLSREAVKLPCSGNNQPRDTDLGLVTGSGDPPSGLTITVNGGSTATVNNITVSNPVISDSYQISATVNDSAAAVPTTAEFSIKVRDGIGQEQSFPIKIIKTAVINTLKSAAPTGFNVGDNYSFNFEDVLILTCAPYEYTITGDVPPGLTVQMDIGGHFLRGTLTSGGRFDFFINKEYANGEKLSQKYSVFVNGPLADLPDGVTGWWRAEDDAGDFIGTKNGTVVGNVRFEDGKAGRGFSFDGTDGYVRLPNDTFNPSLDFTFETWFKTDSHGVILGRQSIAAPYEQPQFGSTPAIYVDQNGKLRAQMFQDQHNRFVTSQNRVDDNAFHHVAVTYRRDTNVRTVFLDGVEIGSYSGVQFASPQKYQLGTGYISDGTVGGLNGWFNFKGSIDEPALYKRVLSTAEIERIFVAGDAGKIFVDVRTTPPPGHNGSAGTITVTALGGTPGLLYSIDGGTTFQGTNSFFDLTPGMYTVVVKDGAGRTVTRIVNIPNPPPGLSLTTSVVRPLCSGAQTGEITVYATGLTGPAEYSVLNGANPQASNEFTGLNAGTYTPWIRDINSDTVFRGDPVFLTQPPPISFSPSGFVNASVNVPYSQTFTISGGTPPFAATASGSDSNNGLALPDGLTAVADANSITISGTPTTAGTFPIAFVIHDQNSCATTRQFPLNIMAPTAAGVSVSGKVRLANGRGISRAVVTVTTPAGETRTAMTNPFGHFRFAELEAGRTYVFDVRSKGLQFTPQAVFVSEDLTELNFTAQ
jgi:hypothetical protein